MPKFGKKKFRPKIPETVMEGIVIGVFLTVKIIFMIQIRVQLVSHTCVTRRSGIASDVVEGNPKI